MTHGDAGKSDRHRASRRKRANSSRPRAAETRPAVRSIDGTFASSSSSTSAQDDIDVVQRTMRDLLRFGHEKQSNRHVGGRQLFRGLWLAVAVLSLLAGLLWWCRK